MAGLLNIPKFVDFRNKVKRHSVLKFPMLSLNSKTTLAIHHSLTKQGLGGSNAEGYARYHVDSLGWPSIGYSYVIEPDGTIKFCNDIELRTYHVGDHNNYAIGICLTGDFRNEKPTKEQVESLRNLVAALQKEYPHMKYVHGHNEFCGYSWKECPVFDYKAVLANKSVVAKPTPSKPVSKPTVNPSGEYKGSSVVDYLKSKGIDSSFNNRKKLAAQHDIKNYKGTPEQNRLLLDKLRGNGGNKPAQSKPKAKKKYVQLPKTSSSWRVYPTNKAPVKGNEKGYLNPKKFNGLEYQVLGNPQTDVYTIQTSDFGKVNIYAAKSTGAKVVSK